MHTQQTGRVEQENVGATPDQPALAHFGPGNTTQWPIVFVNPGHPLAVGGSTMRRLRCRNGDHQPWLSN